MPRITTAGISNAGIAIEAELRGEVTPPPLDPIPAPVPVPAPDAVPAPPPDPVPEPEPVPEVAAPAEPEPTGPTDSELARQKFVEAGKQYSQRNYAEAMVLLDEAIQLDPGLSAEVEQGRAVVAAAAETQG